MPDEARELVLYCAANLVGYQSVDYASRYLDEIATVAGNELPGRSDLTVTVARELHHLMAYKDEYEVARLHLASAFDADVRQQFGDGASLKYLLQPPLLERFGLHRKIGLGRSAALTFRMLATGRKVRGTWLDPFGRTTHRRMERALADEYRAQISAALGSLAAAPAEEREASLSPRRHRARPCQSDPRLRRSEGTQRRVVAGSHHRRVRRSHPPDVANCLTAIETNEEPS